MINVNMDVIFTGCISKNEECYNTIIDGEHVERDKKNNFINYFLCFDIYYINSKSVMEFPFVEMISHVLPLSRVKEGFEALNGNYQLESETTIKIVVQAELE